MGPSQEGVYEAWDISTGGGQTKGLHLAVLVVNGPECFINRWCRGVGLLSLEHIMNEEVDEERQILLPPLNIEEANSASTDTALEQLQKLLEKTQNSAQSAFVKTSKIFFVTFLARKVRSSDPKEDGPLLDRTQIPLESIIPKAKQD